MDPLSTAADEGVRCSLCPAVCCGATTQQAEDARRRSRVSDLHVQRSVVAVLGLLHCPLVEDLAAAHSEFGRTVRWVCTCWWSDGCLGFEDPEP